MKYSLINGMGELEWNEGVYVITGKIFVSFVIYIHHLSHQEPFILNFLDGGYHRWAATMSATRHNPNPEFIAWREQMESVRKDIECMFGVLKGRFRIFKTPCMFHKKDDIDNLFFTCVGLHNMLHAWDRRNEWECGVKWGGMKSPNNNQ